MSNEFVGELSYAGLAPETTWGDGGSSGAGSFIYLPVDDYTVQFEPEGRQAAPYLGIGDEVNNKNFRGMPKGQLSCLAYGYRAAGGSQSLMQILIDWALSTQTLLAPTSKSCQWIEGPEIADKQHRGLRINQFTLSGSADDGLIKIALDLMGKDELGNGNINSSASGAGGVVAIPNDKEKIVSTEFVDCTFKLAGVAIQLKSFQYQESYNLAVEYLNSFTPLLMARTHITRRLTFTPIKNSDTYDAYNRATAMTEFTGEIVLKGLHNGTGSTGSWTRGTIDFPRLSFMQAPPQRNKQGFVPQVINMAALKPDTASAAVAATWDEV